jgi:hypothetical protein
MIPALKKALFDIPGPFIYNRAETGFEFAMPNPLEMEPGEYTATTLYSLGPGQDFDMGDLMLPSDNQIALNFKFVVHSALTVDFPRVRNGQFCNRAKAGRAG